MLGSMETDPTQPSISLDQHPRIDELRDGTPEVLAHLETCQRCSTVSQSMFATLDLPKDLVSEDAFRWPGDPLAKGGMALIFEGDDRRLGRKVILKTPREGDEVNEGMARMFQQRVAQEAKILAKLAHPSIVTIYELGRATTGSPFCVLEKVSGRSLRDRLDEIAVDEAADGGKLHLRERLELISNLVAIAEAMAYAHEHHVVHRDITPNNILLGARGEATLIDWGIARDLDAPKAPDLAGLLDEAPTSSGRWQTINAGTPPYVPFEQTQGKAAEPSFDVYSFGVSLYETASGKTPFPWKPGASDVRERHKQLLQFVLWLQEHEEVPPAVPKDPELSGIIARAMAKNPKDRFTADELVKALKQYLTGDLVFSHRYSRTGRLARWVRRHRGVAAAIGVAAVAVLVAALVWVQLARQRQEKAELAAIAASARLDAAEKDAAATLAAKEAEEANARADEAEKAGKDAKALRDAAVKKRKEAEKTKAEAEQAAERAKGDADDAVARWRAAMAAQAEAETGRDEAHAAMIAALGERDNATTARAAAERERDLSNRAKDEAEAERDAANSARESAQADRAKAESDRDAAREGQSRAERERDEAVSGREEVAKERDELRAKLAAAERALAECEQQNTPAPEPSP
jgi:tRNA A-37 threonylcarbamoyl transferase component Bud32